MPSTLLSIFAEVSDPRRDQGKMYPLAPILLFTVLAMLAGARSYRQVHAFIRTHLVRLNGAFGLSLRRAPAYSSIRFILRGLDADDRIILGHLAIDEKSNEIPAAQTMIETLGLTGRLFTMDAMHCQKNFRDCA